MLHQAHLRSVAQGQNPGSVFYTGFLSSVSIPNLRQGLLKHFFESNNEREDVSSDLDVCNSIFSDKSSRENSLDMLYEESHSAQDT